MKLRALDQIHVSSIKKDSLRRGEEFHASKATGEELLKKHPTCFELVSLDAGEKADPPPKNKAKPKPANKAEATPKNKSAG